MLFNRIFVQLCAGTTCVMALPRFFLGSEGGPQDSAKLMRRCVDPPPANPTAVLQTIDGPVKTLSAKVSAASTPAPGTQIVAIINDWNTVNVAINKAVGNFSATVASTVNATWAQNLINYLNSPLGADVNQLSNALITKNQAFGVWRATFKRQLGFTQGNFTLLNNAMLAKIPATPTTLKPAASSAVNKINSYLASAIAAYA